MLCVRFLAHHNMTYVFLIRHEGVEGPPDHVHDHFPVKILAQRVHLRALGGLDTVYPSCSEAGSLSDDVSVRFEMRICASVTKTTFALRPSPAPTILGFLTRVAGTVLGRQVHMEIFVRFTLQQKKKFPACIDVFFSRTPNEKPCRHFTDARNAHPDNKHHNKSEGSNKNTTRNAMHT